MVGVITINYNLSSETVPCIKSVLVSDYQDFIIFLVDNGSSEEDYKRLKESFNDNAKVRIIRIEKNCGYVQGVNTGLKKALESDLDYYMVMNNDTIIDIYAIGSLVEAAKKYYDNAIISGKVYYYDQPKVIQHTGEIITDTRFNLAISPGKNELDIGQFEQDLERDVLDDVFWLIPSLILNDVGLYCDYFFLYAEQADYSLRARKKGYKLIFTPKAKLWHKVSMTTGGGNIQSLSIFYWRGQGLFIMQYKHLLPKYFIIVVTKCIAKFTLRALFKRGPERKCAAALLRGYASGFIWMFSKGPNNGYNPYQTINKR